MSLVPDASESRESIEFGFAEAVRREAWVSALWSMEVANIFEHGIVRKLHDAAFRDTTLTDLSQLSIAEDSEQSQHAWASHSNLS